ncbi:unnamed protein product [Ceratitis capitata]|uniref:(Mediterranean fruit fly) hypothetical protein n=1 Tax=Ceratitis capitata TaxID=7213 RepID=A0A811V798_CERCA|nr:unnamed protein product [Ceratitis capitata]
MLLEEYFQLRVEFAPGSLIPTLPLRLNYILWLEDLITSLKLADTADVRGIDIGCGSSCIYTLLGARKNSWHMYALESNDVNLEFARSNVKCNNLEHLVEIFKQTNKLIIFKDFFDSKPNVNFHFVYVIHHFTTQRYPILFTRIHEMKISERRHIIATQDMMRS